MTYSRGVIVGYGNPMCGDDALGWIVLDKLQHYPAMHSHNVKLLTVHQLTPELTIELKDADWVYFVDVSEDTNLQGFVQYPVVPASEDDGMLLFGHRLTPQQVLALTQYTFAQCPPEAYVVTCCGKNFMPGDTLSADVTILLPELVEHLIHEINPRLHTIPEEY